MQFNFDLKFGEQERERKERKRERGEERREKERKLLREIEKAEEFVGEKEMFSAPAR